MLNEWQHAAPFGGPRRHRHAPMVSFDMSHSKEQLQRIVIIGNSGSGKSHLARQLSSKLGFQIIHFDEHFWEPGGFNKKRLPEIVHSEIKQLSLKEKWIMEGVFGDLAATALENATALIFLNKPWDECRSALLERGSESSKQLDPAVAEKNFKELMSWAEAYTQRENSRSLKGHTRLYTDFKGSKFLFQDRQSVADFVSAL
ncbi:MAG: AAA family ATPase [Bdellovibrionales bacterium]